MNDRTPQASPAYARASELPNALAVNPHLLAALALTAAFHGSLLFYTFKRTYDAYVHIFFADHYARAWFDHWEYRWYTGFTMTSYPPGSQQSVALLSSFLGLQNAYILVQMLAYLLVVVGIYRFARLLVSEKAAGYAALLAVFASGLNETVHVFGQLPTTFSLGFLLNALPFVWQWLQTGRYRYLLLAWSLNAATTAGHHVTTLFGAVFFMGPIIVIAIVERFRTPLDDEPGAGGLRRASGYTLTTESWRPLVVRRLRRIVPVLGRTALYGSGLILLLLVVVLPYWLWSTQDPIAQVPIPHASRDSFILNPNAGLVFWLIPYGAALPLLPYIFYRVFSTKAWPVGLSLGLLVLLGTGGTTPIPKLLLRGAFDILTLDRFTFWATILILPFLGQFVVSLRHGRVAGLLQNHLGNRWWQAIQLGLLTSYLAVAVFTVNLTQFRRFQPEPIDMQPIVAFLAKDQHWRWRYLTLGFGDQLAWLSAQTTATTVDGNYHSARRLPELTSTSVERLEGAKFRGIPGIGSLQQFLAVPDKYNLKFVFSNDTFYDPLLYFSGWHRVQRLENGIMVWEREDIPPLPERLPRKEIPLYQRLMWGFIPPAAVVTALLALGIACNLPQQAGATRSLPWGLRTLWRRFDAWLWQRSRLPARQAFAEPPQSRRLPRIVVPGIVKLAGGIPRRQRALTLAMFLVGLTISGLIAFWPRPLSPEAVVQAYYDDLDFRRFEAAYDRLDPAARPTFEQFLLERSVTGGILASYAKLERLETSIVAREEHWVRVRVHADWLTALERYQTTHEHEVSWQDGRWSIAPTPGDITVPPDQFIRQGTVAWHAQGRRRVTTGTTDFGDVLDRPEVEILSARLVSYDGRYVVVGELINSDVDPADVTVAAYLYDGAGTRLAWYNAQTAMLHKVLPKEVTPFRIDFEGVAGADLQAPAADFQFDPAAFTDVSLSGVPAGFEVHARAVVTGRDLNRAVTIQRIGTRNGLITGELLNGDTVEATVPQVLLTYYDAGGRVAWVEQYYVEEAIRPQRSLSFAFPIPPAAPLTPIFETGDFIANILEANGVADVAWAERLVLPDGGEFAAVRLTVNYFVAGQ